MSTSHEANPRSNENEDPTTTLLDGKAAARAMRADAASMVERLVGEGGR